MECLSRSAATCIKTVAGLTVLLRKPASMKPQVNKYGIVALLISAQSAFALDLTWNNVESTALAEIAGAVGDRKTLINKISTHDTVISSIDNRLKVVDGQTSIASTEAFSGMTLSENLTLTSKQL
jgi:hypothetical protein